MKDLLFAADLLIVFRQDEHYSVQKNLANALRKFHLPCNESTEQMVRTLTLHILEQCGESEPFLTGTFISSEALTGLFKKQGLRAPAATTMVARKEPTVQEQFEKHFDSICRNCGTVTDPLGMTYRTPIGRLIFRTYLETLQSQGVKTTAWYILRNLKDFDEEKIVTAVEEDYVTWKTEDDKEKLTSVHTIGKFVLILDREAAKILGR
jgi:hypothetical protein